MSHFDQAREHLARIPALQVTRNEPLSRHTRFQIGGPAAVFAETANEDAFIEAARWLKSSGLQWAVIGAGSNLIVHDGGFNGAVLRYRGAAISGDGRIVNVAAGAGLQSLVDFAIERGLAGLHTMTGIPGSTGAAIYGNAGAYGQSVSDTLMRVRFFECGAVRELDNAGCEFRYRDSVFKRRKDWLILSAEFMLSEANAGELKRTADEILAIRNRKYPPEMRCAGSIFKNLILAELPEPARSVVPPEVVKKGKVPSAWFLDQCGARGMRNGGIVVAGYHANLLYNEGGGTAAEVRDMINELKRRVRGRFGLELEEEVQFLGFDDKERVP
jgi:UDP-N-acetylmuramate dehydrogenase